MKSGGYLYFSCIAGLVSLAFAIAFVINLFCMEFTAALFCLLGTVSSMFICHLLSRKI